MENSSKQASGREEQGKQLVVEAKPFILTAESELTKGTRNGQDRSAKLPESFSSLDHSEASIIRPQSSIFGLVNALNPETKPNLKENGVHAPTDTQPESTPAEEGEGREAASAAATGASEGIPSRETADLTGNGNAAQNGDAPAEAAKPPASSAATEAPPSAPSPGAPAVTRAQKAVAGGSSASTSASPAPAAFRSQLSPSVSSPAANNPSVYSAAAFSLSPFVSPTQSPRHPAGGATAAPRPAVAGSVAALLQAVPACHVEAAEFFVAWQGVLTVAYAGLPPALVELKERLSASVPGLPPENPGSRWPKTTLGCLREGQRLSLPQLQVLRDICSKVSFQLAMAAPVTVDSLSVVLYECCCLERQLCAASVALRQPEDPSPPSDEQRRLVRSVLNEFSARNLPSYWFHASKDGNRSNHYRQTKVGATLVHFLKPHEVPAAVRVFRRIVDAALPGMYDWFAPESLHVTVRALT